MANAVVSSLPPELARECYTCSSTDDIHMRCSCSRFFYYCDNECQLKDWGRHKLMHELIISLTAPEKLKKTPTLKCFNFKECKAQLSIETQNNVERCSKCFFAIYCNTGCKENDKAHSEKECKILADFRLRQGSRKEAELMHESISPNLLVMKRSLVDLQSELIEFVESNTLLKSPKQFRKFLEKTKELTELRIVLLGVDLSVSMSESFPAIQKMSEISVKRIQICKKMLDQQDEMKEISSRENWLQEITPLLTKYWEKEQEFEARGEEIRSTILESFPEYADEARSQ